MDADGTPAGFTLAGPWVNVAVPAEAVISLNPSGEGLADTMPGAAEPQPISGTSYAAPVVSGVAALLRAAAPNLTARQVMHRIESTARGSGWNPLVGHGVVDVLAMLRGIAAPVTPGAPHPLAPPSIAVADAEPATVRAHRRRGMCGAGGGIGGTEITTARRRCPARQRHGRR